MKSNPFGGRLQPSPGRFPLQLRRSAALTVCVLFASCLAAGLLAPPAHAQTLDATGLRQPTDLGAIWLVHGGDDPAYARPDFDDSGWMRFDSRTALRSVIPDSRPEVVWYRLHVKVLPTQTGLALEEWNISSAFEVYVNGEQIMRTGQVAPFEPYTFSARVIAPIPAREIATGSLTIALRVHISRFEWGSSYPGFYFTNLILGHEHALHDHMWLTVIGQNAGGWINSLFSLGLGIVALALFTAQRHHWEYLWIFLQFFCATCAVPLTIYQYFHNVPSPLGLLQQPLSILSAYFTVLMYFAFLRLRFGWWIRTAFLIAVAGQLLSLVGQTQGSLSTVATVLALFPLLILIAGILPILLLVHLRRGNREAGILLIPVILESLTIYAQLFVFFVGEIPGFEALSQRVNDLLFAYPAGPFQLSLSQFSGLLYLLSLAIIMVLRSTRISRQQAVLEGEVAAAREVQQIILPEQIDAVPGFAIESVYQPAQQVGGDFFQVLPAGEGGLLVVVGDVAGKGLPAAMLVSVLVGAIRAVADYTEDPAEMLANLNDRLVGRSGAAFSTALAARIHADGAVTVANAGHLSPYLDGREIELPGALPLGIKPHVRYETRQFYFPAGSRLTFYSDGVVEATNPRGELLGFERGRELSTQPAAVIAETARKFGQEDDITVVAIIRQAAIAAAA
ncbi:MAG: PP2C family protein-serine/threonine phosphatase [Terracidiphilus sp.]